MIQSSGRDVLLQLAIPRLPVTLDEPGTKRRELFRSKLLDFSFERFDFRHDDQYSHFSADFTTETQSELSVASVSLW